MTAQQALRRENGKLRARIEQLQQLVITDALTGCRNRRHFDDTLLAELERARRGRYSVGLALIDVDHFKQINDTLGHPAGDGVLREVGRRLRAAAREGDQIYRYGGEEFAMLFAPAATFGMKLLQVGERLRAAVGGTPIPPAERVTVSIGLSVFHGAFVASVFHLQPVHALSLVQRADRALYRSKQEGRDRCWTEES